MFRILSLKLFNLIPAESFLLLRAAQRYVDRFNGDNNSDSSSNGEHRFLRNELRKYGESGVVFDVGANVGEWTKYCLNVAPNLNMHLFEPSKFTFKKLQSNIWSISVHLNNFGLGERKGQLNLNIAGDASGMNSIHRRQGVKGVEIETVEIIDIQTLDAYCDENSIAHINLLKVDVEGHELEVFKGAKKMLSEKRISCIQFEYGGCNLDARVYLLDIWDYLTAFGYKIGKIYPDKIKYLSNYDQTFETFRYSNYIALLDKVS